MYNSLVVKRLTLKKKKKKQDKRPRLDETGEIWEQQMLKLADPTGAGATGHSKHPQDSAKISRGYF